MTTLISFPSNTTASLTFQATLDGTIYTCVTTWNMYGQRWYLNIYTLEQTLIVCTPLIGSPPDYDISLTAGYFTTTIVYRIQNSQIEIS